MYSERIPSQECVLRDLGLVNSSRPYLLNDSQHKRLQPVIRRQRRGRVHGVWLDDANFANEEGAMGKKKC